MPSEYRLLFSVCLYRILFPDILSSPSFSTTLYKWTVCPILLAWSRGKQSHSEIQRRVRLATGEDIWTQCQRPTGCLTCSWNWISVRICWFFTKWWSLDFRLLARTKYKVWQCVWPKLEFFGCGEIWGQNQNPVLLPQLKPLKIVPHCGFWDSKKRQLQVVYYTWFGRLMGI